MDFLWLSPEASDGAHEEFERTAEEGGNATGGGVLFWEASCLLYPIGSMYGIFTYIWLIFRVNVGKYTIHGSYGYPFLQTGVIKLHP